MEEQAYPGLTDAEFREAKKFAKEKLKGNDPDPIKVPETTEPVVEAASEEEPAVVEETSETKPEAAEQATPADAVEEADPLAGLPEETRTKIASLLDAERKKALDLQHRESSARGRLSAFQKKADDASRRASELEAKLASQSSPQPKPLKDLDTPRLKELAENDPAYLEALEEALTHRDKQWEERIKAKEDKFDKYVSTQEQSRQEDYNRQFTDQLDSKYDNWREIVYRVGDDGRVQTNEDGQPLFSDQWAHCIREQPPALQRAMLDISTPEDALWAIEHHTGWLKSQGYVKDAVSTPPNPQADKIKEKREQDLKKGPVPRSASIPLSPATPELADYSDDKALQRLRDEARKVIAGKKSDIYREAR